MRETIFSSSDLCAAPGGSMRGTSSERYRLLGFYSRFFAEENGIDKWFADLATHRNSVANARKADGSHGNERMAKNGGGGGSRTPVRKALRHEAYMLISIRCAIRPLRD